MAYLHLLSLCGSYLRKFFDKLFASQSRKTSQYPVDSLNSKYTMPSLIREKPKDCIITLCSSCNGLMYISFILLSEHGVLQNIACRWSDN